MLCVSKLIQQLYVAIHIHVIDMHMVYHDNCVATCFVVGTIILRYLLPLNNYNISVNILEAKKLAWTNTQSMNSYVVVILGKEKHRTSVRKNMKDPIYGEYFLFEWYASIREVQRASLWLAVMEPKCCAPPHVLGESSIDLGAIWAQPNHQVFHKWAQLSLPREITAGSVGFLKVDISIVCREDIQVMPLNLNQDQVEEKMQFYSPTSEQQTANYMITVHGAFGLLPGWQGDKRYPKLPNTYVKVSFCGLSAKTAVQYHTNCPAYCEQISIVEVFPNICQIIRFELCSADICFNKALATTDLRLGCVSHDGENGFVPTFGPSLLHMYGINNQNVIGSSGEDGPYYKGALLVSLKTVVPYCQQRMRSTNVEPVAPIQPSKIWSFESFCIFCPIFEVSMLNRQITGKYSGVAISIGEINYGQKHDADFKEIADEIKSKKLHYTGLIDVTKTGLYFGHFDFASAYPVLQLGCSLPDFTNRIFRNNMIVYMVVTLERALNLVEERLRNIDDLYFNELVEGLTIAIDEASMQILKFLDFVQPFSKQGPAGDYQCLTELDQKQVMLQKEELEKIHHQLCKKTQGNTGMSLNQILKSSKDYFTCPKKELKLVMAEIKCIIQKLKKITFKATDGWPEIVIWLLNGSSRVAYHKISAVDVIFSSTPEQCGKDCGRIQTFYLKPLKCLKHMNSLSSSCYCIAGKVELLLWMGTYNHSTSFHTCLPQGFKLKMKDDDICIKCNTQMLECRVFIYRAKLNPCGEALQAPSPFVRINALNSFKQSLPRPATLTPVWNQVLKIRSLAFSSYDRLMYNPPEILVEVCDEVADKTDYLGRLSIEPVVDERTSYEFSPKLKWYNLIKGSENVGQILLSAQLLQIPETLIRSTFYNSIDKNVHVPDSNDFVSQTDDFEELPTNLLPKTTTYKIDLFWWGLRDVEVTKKPCAVLEIDDLTVKSDIISDNKPNCNFPNGRISQVFEAPLNEVYCPPLKIRLYDSSTFGRTLFLGTKVVLNPNKYVVDWIPKYVRDRSLKSASIISANFSQVSDNVYVKKSVSYVEESSEEDRLMTLDSRSRIVKEPRKNIFRRLFCFKAEEEEALIPLYHNAMEKELCKTMETQCTPEFRDWWLRFSSSQKGTINKHASPNAGRIKIYDSELELQPEFSQFKDWCKTLKLYSSNKTGIPERDKELRFGCLKAGIVIYAWPPPSDIIAVNSRGINLETGYFSDYPNNDPTKYLVRVYVVRGIKIAIKDFIRKSDAYVVINCGSKQSGDRSQYVPNTVNPVFGKMYEFRCSLPEDYLLTISLHNHDSNGHDDLIGSTAVDLENRVYTKHRATVGLSSEYNVSGPFKWRDGIKPSAILEELCIKNHIETPKFPNNNSVIFCGVTYMDNDKSSKTYISATERKENLCLILLQKWQTLPVCGHHLVPEHVETRTLYNPDRPGVEQGKIQMWVDIFALETTMFIPLPVDITPRKVEDYELRLKIWEIKNLRIDSANQNPIEIYLKAWIGSEDQAQYTDINYYNGKRKFHWRMIFNFSYQHIEKKVIRKEMDIFTEFEERVSPLLLIQVIDNDAIDYSDYLASLTLDLSNMPCGLKLPADTPYDIENIQKKVSLFSIKTIRGWWPMKLMNRNTGVSTYAGMIELEMILLPKDKAVLEPVGMGRDPPFPLQEPSSYYTHAEVPSQNTKPYFASVFGKGGERLLPLVVIAVLLWIAYYFEIPCKLIEQFVDDDDDDDFTRRKKSDVILRSKQQKQT